MISRAVGHFVEERLPMLTRQFLHMGGVVPDDIDLAPQGPPPSRSPGANPPVPAASSRPI